MISNHESMWNACSLRFASDHPTAAGHFPGDPIIPGALLLAHVLRAIDADHAAPVAREIRQVKFFHVLRPGDEATIRWRTLATGVQEFEVRVCGRADAVMIGSAQAMAE